MRDMRQWDRGGCSGGCGEGECRVKRWVWALAGWWQNGAKWCISTVSWGSKHWFVCFLFQMNLPLKENYDMGSLAQVVILSEHSLPVWVLKDSTMIPWCFSRPDRGLLILAEFLSLPIQCTVDPVTEVAADSPLQGLHCLLGHLAYQQRPEYQG